MINHPNLTRKRRAVATAAVATSHNHDADYAALLDSVRASFARAVEGNAPLFTTDAEGLFDIYLDNLPGERQVHTCTCCRTFVKNYGGLVCIGDDGQKRSALWPTASPPAFYVPAMLAVNKAISKASVTGPFLSADATCGTPRTRPDWTHFAVDQPAARRFKHAILTPGQAMAAKREDFRTVAAALSDFTPPLLAQAMRLLEADALARSERFIGPVQWLQELHEKRGAVKDARVRDNLLWRAIATAPDGFCHPRASVVGSLLEDIAAGLAFEDVKARFNAKMHPLRYQRPQAAPAAGALAQAEKLFETMGLAPALERRFARLDECETLWRPTSANGDKPVGGVFGHLTAKGAEAHVPLDIPALTMTWEKFARVVLPEAETMELMVPHGNGNFMAFVTATRADAPPIIRWDREDKRNPVSVYVYHHGSPPAQWRITPGWCCVASVVPFPAMWGDRPLPHLGDGVALILDGAVDTQTGQGIALFPEIVRDELHGVRSVIEAFSRKAELTGREDGSACGVALGKGGKWPGYAVRITSRGQQSTYRLDRWD